VSYFRPPKARKTGPWSITRLSNSTQKMSQKGGRVKNGKCANFNCLNRGVHPIKLCPILCHTYIKNDSSV
jgi:hypothetical protein